MATGKRWVASQDPQAGSRPADRGRLSAFKVTLDVKHAAFCLEAAGVGRPPALATLVISRKLHDLANDAVSSKARNWPNNRFRSELFPSLSDCTIGPVTG